MITYRTTGAWGPGKGSNLTPVEIDGNFFDLAERMAEVEENPVEPNQIANIIQDGATLTFHMDDGSTFGPFTMPRSVQRPTLTTTVSSLSLTPDTTQVMYFFRCTHSGGCTVTIADTPTPFLVDSELHFRHCGDDPVEFEEGAGVTLNVPDGHNPRSAFKGAVVVAKKIGTLEWDLYGDLEKTSGAGERFELIVAASDESTAITTGTAKATFRMPAAVNLTDVRASLKTGSSSGVVTIDINEGGSSLLSTKLTIDASEKTSTTAATAAVISDSTLADDAEITIDIDTAGTGAAGLKVMLIGTRT